MRAYPTCTGPLLTATQLTRVLRECGVARERAEEHAPHLLEAMALGGIDTRAEASHYLAQVLHETGKLRWITELWGPTKAQARYDVRTDLGNTPERDGDGFRYRGRGLFQTTGRRNYARLHPAMVELFGEALPDGTPIPDFEANPDLVAEPRWAALSSLVYWTDNGLSALAAGEDEDDVRRVSGVINRGTASASKRSINGWADRLALFKKVGKALRAEGL